MNNTAQISTVEEALERAVFENGMIAPTNMGDHKRLKWTRSSRTDKGVHSLSTVRGSGGWAGHFCPSAHNICCVCGLCGRSVCVCGLSGCVNTACTPRTHTPYTPSQVIGINVLLDESRFDSDPEGLEYATAISTRLPPDIRVFAVQRTNKRLDTRRACIDRWVIGVRWRHGGLLEGGARRSQRDQILIYAITNPRSPAS